MNLDQFRAGFFEEVRELLAEMAGHLERLERGEQDGETLNAVFRAVHSVKGGAGALGYKRLVAFSHKFETVLSRLRDSVVPINPDSIAIVQRGADCLADLVQATAADRSLPDNQEAEIVAAFETLIEVGAAAEPALSAPREAAAPAPVACYRIRFAPTGDALRSGNEPLLILRDLKRLGRLEVALDAASLPSLDALDPFEPYLAWTVVLNTESSLDAIRERFDFIEDACDLAIAPDAPDVAAGPVVPARVAAAPPATEARAATAPAAPKPPAAMAATASSIRVDLEKVDRLVNMVGELVITQSMLAQQTTELQRDRFPNLFQGLDDLAQHTRDLQENVMAIRAQPVAAVFQRLPRLVRELATQTGKRVRLVLLGEGTEIDKTVVERLGDPLVHLVRNAIDHGLEGPSRRQAAGKLPEGTITISAEHRSGRIVIEVADDGNGIDRDRVLGRAIERGIVAADATLSDEDIVDLIFQPGFSTADAVSDISGRGVGMDVVRKNISDLGGRVLVRSVPGKGTRFVCTLPLTLAVFEGMMLTVGAETYVLPLSSIIESLRPAPRDLHELVNVGEVLFLRGDYVRLIWLSRVFEIPGAIEDPSRGLVILVETEEGDRIGLVVDDLLGQQQVVIKSLEQNFHRVGGVAAATILGDGRVALILDPSGLRRIANRQPQALAGEARGDLKRDGR